MANTIDELRDTLQQHGPPAMIDALITALRERGEFHRMFDALLLKSRLELGLPPERLTSFDNVPDDRKDAFQQAYIAAAREAGTALLEAGKPADAWIYFRTIDEPGPVAAAIEKLAAEVDEAGDQLDQLVNVALYEGAHPVKGLELILKHYGICNTITTLDQALGQLKPDQRQAAAAMLVRELHGELLRSLQYDLQQRGEDAAATSISELINGRDELFEGGTYHIDVSHLNSVVRFARLLEPDAPELKLALELAEYGARLDPQFQYGGEPPFGDFYSAHRHLFKALLGEDVDAAVAYFRKQLSDEPDEQDQQMIAYVLVDLLQKIGRFDEAAEVAAEHLSRLDDPQGFSFPSLCRKAGRLDLLEAAARKNDDLLHAALALLPQSE